jgi:nicotinamidase-related amidase
LVLIDVQEKLTAVMHERDRLVESLIRLIRGAQLLGLPIVWCEQNPQGLGPTVGELAGLLGDLKPIEKKSFGCMGSAEFAERMGELSPHFVLLAGIETHVCVYQTAAQLAEANYEVQVVADAVSSRTHENKALGLERIRASGASLTSVETVLFELLGTAEDARFREILKIVK